MMATMTPATRHLALHVAGWLAAASVLCGVFVLYTRPAFMVRMIDQLWACF